MGPIIVGMEMIDDRTMGALCNAAREAVELPPIDWDWHERWGRQIDCEPCPGNVVCEHYAFMRGIAREVTEFRRADA